MQIQHFETSLITDAYLRDMRAKRIAYDAASEAFKADPRGDQLDALLAAQKAYEHQAQEFAYWIEVDLMEFGG